MQRKDRQEIEDAVQRDPSLERVAQALGVTVRQRKFVIFTEHSFVPYAFETREEAEAYGKRANVSRVFGGWDVVPMSPAEAKSLKIADYRR
jgi:hypothetical protein